MLIRTWQRLVAAMFIACALAGCATTVGGGPLGSDGDSVTVTFNAVRAVCVTPDEADDLGVKRDSKFTPAPVNVSYQNYRSAPKWDPQGLSTKIAGSIAGKATRVRVLGLRVCDSAQRVKCLPRDAQLVTGTENQRVGDDSRRVSVLAAFRSGTNRMYVVEAGGVPVLVFVANGGGLRSCA